MDRLARRPESCNSHLEGSIAVENFARFAGLRFSTGLYIEQFEAAAAHVGCGCETLDMWRRALLIVAAMFAAAG